MSKYTYIICGKLYNGIDAEFKEGYKILVKDNKIEAVGREIPQPETAEVVDLSDATVTPGMIDAHMHMDYIDWHTIREEVYTTSEEAKTIAIIRTAQKTLSRGFTTVRHPGGITSNGFGVLDVKRAIEKGYITGSRIVAAPRFLCAAGSHGDLSQGFARNPELSNIVQNLRLSLGAGKDFFVNAVREEIKYGADFIKIMTTGILDFNEHGAITGTPLDGSEVKEMVHIAHEEGMAVMSHTNGDYGVQAAVAAGVDSLEHGNYMNEESLAMLAESDTVWVPTLVTVRNLLGDGRYDDETLKPIIESAEENIRKAFRLGIKTAPGSDAGAYRVLHGKGIRDEVQSFAEILGDQDAAYRWLAEGEAEIKKKFTVTVHW